MPGKSPNNIDDKPCKVCGRAISWRKKWEKNWDSIQYCSDACRQKKSTIKNSYEETILLLLAAREGGKTICPSEVLSPEDRQDKALMETVREAARRLVAKDTIEILQKGSIVDPSTAKGPIRLRLKAKEI